jgi:RNA polymerase sigma-70 factor, ECF subfamily
VFSLNNVNARAFKLVATDADDSALVLACQAGNSGAFEALMQRHQAVVAKVLRRLVRNSEEAKDLTQRAFTNAFVAIQNQSIGQSPFRPYVLRIALNLGHNSLRDSKRWFSHALESVSFLSDRKPDVQALLEEREQMQAISRVVDSLPQRQSEVFSLRIDGALPFAEIATALNISEDSAKASFHLALKRLREHLQGETR